MNKTPIWNSVSTVAILAAAAIVLSFSGAADAKTYRLTHNTPEAHPNHKAAVRMVDAIRERTHGEVDIQIFPNNALGAPNETIGQVRMGIIDYAISTPADMDKFARPLGVVFTPYQFSSYDDAHAIIDGPGHDWLAAQALKAGFEWIAPFEWGFRALTNNVRPINGPDDVKGLKIRVPPEIQNKAAMEGLGANTQTISFTEVYMALASGVVDGQENPIATIYTYKLYEVQKHLALTRHIYAPMIMVANENHWKSLTDEQRKIIREEATKAGAEARAEVGDQEEAMIADMQKSGVQVTRPDVSQFRSRMGDAYKIVRDYVGEEAWDSWSKIMEKARASK